MWQWVEILNVRKSFPKIWSTVFSWKHQDWNTSIPHKTALSEANVKNRMVSIKWTYHKECSFTSNYSVFFWNVCFSLRTCYEEIVWCTNHPNLHIYAFRRSCSFIWGCRSSRPEVFCEKVFLEISQDSQENTYARVSF